MDNMVSCIEQLCYVNGNQTKHLFASLFENHNGGSAGVVGTPRSGGGIMSAPSSDMIMSRNGSRSGSNDGSMSDFLFESFYDDEDVVGSGENQ